MLLTSPTMFMDMLDKVLKSYSIKNYEIKNISTC